MQRTHSSAGWFFHLKGLSWSKGATIINKTANQLIEQDIKKLLAANQLNCSVTRFVAANDWA
jgi:cobalamin biosynthesis protein CbiD